jgi:hypothetical protein
MCPYLTPPCSHCHVVRCCSVSRSLSCPLHHSLLTSHLFIPTHTHCFKQQSVCIGTHHKTLSDLNRIGLLFGPRGGIEMGGTARRNFKSRSCTQQTNKGYSSEESSLVVIGTSQRPSCGHTCAPTMCALISRATRTTCLLSRGRRRPMGGWVSDACARSSKNEQRGRLKRRAEKDHGHNNEQSHTSGETGR